MNKVKKALLATSMAGALVVSAGYGTYSWFTSSTSAVGDIDNGTLSVNNGEAISTKLFSAAKFAPSQVVTGEFITLDNTGDLAQNLKLTYEASVDKAPADPYKIYYMAFKYTAKPDMDEMNDWRMAWEKGFYNGNHNPRTMGIASASKSDMPSLPKGVEVVTGEVAVEEAASIASFSKSAASETGGSKTFKIGNDEFFTLNEDEYITMAFDVKLDDGAGNEYQGAQYDANLMVEAKQTDMGAKYKNKENK
jgi:spore coat-associated protein N